MNNLIPNFILKKYYEKLYKGKLKAVVMFMDISGFTPLTEKLMTYGKEGAEILNSILNRIFEPVIDAVYKRDGFISTFSGDAFTALFPINKENKDIIRALYAAIQIIKIFKQLSFQKTKAGDFNFFVKIGMSFGSVNWEIKGNKNQKIYYYWGNSLKRSCLAEHEAKVENIILDKQLFFQINNKINIKKLDKNLYLLKKIKIKENLKSNPFQKKKVFNNINAFLPKKIINYSLKGEFKDIVSVFISFKKSSDIYNNSIKYILENTNFYGGYIENFDFGDKGNACIVIFGIPTTYEDNLNRAINFIIALRKEIISDFKAGITYGSVFCGIKGSKARAVYGVLGSIVNLSCRMMEKAKWNQILITNEISEKIHNNFNSQSLGKYKFKGILKPIEIYELLKRKEFSENIFENKIIGREKELILLHKITKAIFNGKFAGIVYIYGEAGIGKSHLLFAFSKSIEKDILTFTLQTDNVFKTSLNPFTNFFNRYFNFSENQSFKIKKNNFEKTYNNLIYSIKTSKISSNKKNEAINELKRMKSIIASIVGLRWKNSIFEKLSIENKQKSVYLAIKEFFKSQSLLKPVLLILEDLHWLDNESHEVFKILTRGIENYPIAIFFSSRILKKAYRPKIIFDKNIKAKEIILKELSENLSINLIKNTIGHKPGKKLISFLLNRTEKNPYYIEQYCIYLQKSEFLELKNNQLNLKKQTTFIPKDINTLLTAQIDRLSSELKETVQIASVLGREFENYILCELIKDFKLKNLQKKDCAFLLLRGEEERIWSTFSKTKYFFKHTLLRDTVYDMQLRERLKKLHYLSANSILKLHINDKNYFSHIAFHFEKAEKTKYAMEYYNKSGIFEMDNYKLDLALEYFSKSLSFCLKIHRKDPKNIASIFQSIGEIYWKKGIYDKALEFFNKCYEINKTISKKNNLDIALILDFIGKTHREKGNYLESVKFHKKALAIKKKLLTENNNDIADSYNHLGLSNKFLGKCNTALKYFKVALDIQKNMFGENHIGISYTFNNIGSTYREIGENKKALNFHFKSLKIKEKILGSNHLDTAESYNNIGVIYKNLKDYNNSLIFYLKSQKIAEAILGKKHPHISVLYNNIGALYGKIKERKKALDFYSQAVEIHKETLGLTHPNIIANYNHISALYWHYKDYKNAILYCYKAMDIADNYINIPHRFIATTYLNMSRLKREEKKFIESLEYANKSLKISKKIFGNNSHFLIQIHILMSEIYEQLEERVKALKHLNIALNIAKIHKNLNQTTSIKKRIKKIQNLK